MTTPTKKKRIRGERYKGILLNYWAEKWFGAKNAQAKILGSISEEKKPKIPLVNFNNLKSEDVKNIKDLPLLNFEQEQHVFRKYNFLKYKLNEALKKKDIAEADKICENVVILREFILNCNFKLIYFFLKNKKHISRYQEEIYSDCCLVVLRAIDYFDYRLKNKFSTYVISSLHKVISSTVKNLIEEDGSCKLSMPEGFMESKEDFRVSLNDDTERDFRKTILSKAIDYLEKTDSRAYEIITASFGLKTGEKQTLEDIGVNIKSRDNRTGISKERVRQIRKSALKKLKKYLESQGLEKEALFD